MNRQEWLEARKSGIGASDAASIIGLNPWKTNVRLWEEKTGFVESEDISDKPVVKYGNDAEPLLRELFKLDFPQYSVKYDKFKMFHNEEYPFIFATLDGELVEKDTGRKGILEIKTTEIMNSSQWGKWKDGIPQNYYCQCLWQLLATGFDFVVLRAQIKSNRHQGDDKMKIETKHYWIEKKDVQSDMDYMEECGVKFWNENVLKKVKPNLILPSI